MQIAFRLGRDLDEVLLWSPEKFELWVAFFNVKAEREAQAAKASRQRPPSQGL